MITVSKLLDQTPLISPHQNTNPLLTLLGLDTAIIEKRGRVHETVLGFSYAENQYMSRREHIVTANPPEWPA